MKSGSKIGLIVLAVATIAILTGMVAFAAPPSVFAGQWEATDIDGSHLELNVSGGRGRHRLAWRDDFWTICAGRPGIGTGTGIIDSVDPNIMHATLNFRCSNTGFWGTLAMDFVYSPGTGTMVNIGPGSVTWSPVSHP